MLILTLSSICSFIEREESKAAWLEEPCELLPCFLRIRKEDGGKVSIHGQDCVNFGQSLWELIPPALLLLLHNTETETAQRYPSRSTVSDDEACVIQTISNSAAVLIFSINALCPRTAAEVCHCFVKESKGTAIKVLYVRMKERN